MEQVVWMNVPFGVNLNIGQFKRPYRKKLKKQKNATHITFQFPF